MKIVNGINTGYLLVLIMSLLSLPSMAQQKMVRLAKLEIDSLQLKSYKAFLKEEIETSLRVEKGVHTLYAVFEKENPARVTILEIYADSTAYKSHIKTPHFLKYKNGTANMVKSLQLIEVDPLIPEMKFQLQY
jgi:quinol monooxygenase YgiN